MIADKKIKVLLVDDSPLVLTVLQRCLNPFPEIEVVGTACNGREALASIPTLEPQVICCDLHMPVMDGLEFTRQVMARFPRPILMVSDYVHEKEKANVFAAIEAGAIDVMPKPQAGFAKDDGAAVELLNKIKILAGVRTIKRRIFKAPPKNSGAVAHAPKLVAIGASTGGPRALQTILKALPADFSAPILCVQHISRGFTLGMVQWLQRSCALRVEIARAGHRPAAGNIYFASEERHLVIDAHGYLQHSNAPPFTGHRPSVEMLFQSLATHCPHQVLALLLTGMGTDGASGLLELSRAGAMTVAQDEASCEVFGMPRKAIELGAAQQIWNLGEISDKINALCKESRAS